MDFEFVESAIPQEYIGVTWGVGVAIFLLVLGISIWAQFDINQTRKAGEPAEIWLWANGVIVGAIAGAIIAGIMTLIGFFIWGPDGGVREDETATALSTSIEEEYGATLAASTVESLLVGMHGSDSGGSIARSEASEVVLWGSEEAEIALAWYGDQWIIIDATETDSYVEMERVD